MMFAIYAKDILVGHSALEFGDPPMGVAFGKFFPADAYRQIQHECQSNHADQSGLALNARTPAGLAVPCVGVSILECAEVSEFEPAEVNVLGIPYPLYGELFPEHVAAYEQLFDKR